MKKLLGLVLVLAIVAVGAAAWSGVVQVPVVSHALGMDHARDLGAAPADATAYAAWSKQLGLAFSSPDANYTFASKHTFAGTVKLDGTVPEGTLTGMREFGNPAPGISDVHVRFHAGSMETSAIVDLAPYGYPLSGPVYARAAVTVTGPRTVSVSVSSLTFGNITVPSDIAAKAQDAINSYLATRLATIDGLSIKHLAFVDGAVDFTGTVPKSYGADIPAKGTLP